MPKIALISIKPQFANQILFGVKKFEYRKTSIAEDTTHLLLYMTTPVKKIVGYAKVKKIHVGAPSVLWEATKREAGIIRDFYRSYFRGSKKAYAIELETVTPLNKWVDPKMIYHKFRAPQSFKYIETEFFNQILKESEEITLRKKNNLVFLSGIHGVGKGHFCAKLKDLIDIEVYGASELIKRSRGEVKRDKKVTNIQKNQDILVQEINKQAQEGLFILEGHFCLIDQNNEIENIPLSTYQEMNPKEIFLLENSIEQIQINLMERDTKKYEISFIEELLQREKEYGIYVANKLGIPIWIIQHSDANLVSEHVEKILNQ